MGDWQQSKLIDVQYPQTIGSHCLVEWDEPGKPYSIVENKQVKGFEDVSVGDMCSVGLCRGVKSIYYDAKLLATGESHKCSVYTCVCICK